MGHPLQDPSLKACLLGSCLSVGSHDRERRHPERYDYVLQISGGGPWKALPASRSLIERLSEGQTELDSSMNWNGTASSSALGPRTTGG